MKYKIALYIRVSTEEQAENPEGSIKNQEERLREYVKIKNYDGDFGEIVEVYCDPGISAKDLNRPAAQRLLRDIEKKKIDLVMVTELSRLTRSNKDFAMLWDYLSEHGCKFQSLRDNFDSTTPAGEMIMFTLANFAQFERKQLGERIANAFQARSKRGLWNGGLLPLGYDIDRDRQGHLVVVEEEAEIVKKTFETFLKEETLSRTGRALNEQGIKMPRKLRNGISFRNSHFTVENVYRLLTNKAYIGVRVFKIKDEIKETKAVWQPLIDVTTFERVGKILKENFERRKKPSSPHRFPFSLTGILICKTCGDRLCGKSANGNGGKIAYYEHARHAKSKSLLLRKELNCDPKRILAAKIEPVVWSDVQRVLTDKVYAKTLFDEAQAKLVGSECAEKVAKTEKRIVGLEIQTESLVQRIAELPAGLDAKPFFSQIKKIQVEAEMLKLSLEDLKNQTQESPIRFEQFEKFSDDLRKLLKEECSPESRAAIICRLVAKILVSPTGITIQYHVGENHYFKEFGGPTSNSSRPTIKATRPRAKPLAKYSLKFIENKDLEFRSAYGSASLTFGGERNHSLTAALTHRIHRIPTKFFV